MLIHIKSLLNIYFAFCLVLRVLLRRDKGRLVGSLSLGRESGEMAALARLPIDESAVLGDSVVPDAHGAIVPFDANLEISRDGNVL